MRPRDRYRAERLQSGLLSFDQEKRPLPGIREASSRDALVEQIVESIRRISYVSVVGSRDLSERNADPDDSMFDPLKAAIINQKKNYLDEAFWLVFLSVHFGKNRKGGWRYAREVYGRLGDRKRWNWPTVSQDVLGFRRWLGEHQVEIGRKGAGFGNHRKYESLRADAPSGTGAVVESYIRWVGPSGSHVDRVRQASKEAEGDPRKAFDHLYKSMRVVSRFGRTGRFDYLAMVGNLGLANVTPGKAYLQGATGPLTGARLLFGGHKKAALKSKDLDRWLVDLDEELGVGMQVLEDALCNWQKSPSRFRRFRG